MGSQLFFKIFLCLVLFLFSSTSIFCKKVITLSSGFMGGTYYTIAKEISKLDSKSFDVVHSKGTIENIRTVHSSKNSYAIVQLDVLQNLMFFDDAIQKNIKVLFLLYSEELHIIANRKISSIQKLRDRNIYMGPQKSGSHSTSSMILSTLLIGKNDVNIVDVPLTTAISDLLSGKLDALFLVAGAPVSLLSDLSLDSRAKKLHLLSIPNKNLEFLTTGGLPYYAKSLSKKQYPLFVGDRDTKTISVYSAFIANRASSSKKIKKFMNLVFLNLPKLQQKHSKFEEIDLANTIKYSKKHPNILHPAVTSFLLKSKLDG